MKRATTGRFIDRLDSVVHLLEEPRSFRFFVFLITGVALAVRISVLLLNLDSWGWNFGIIPDSWNVLAINMVENGTFGFLPHEPTVTRGPVFPFIGMILFALFHKHYLAWSVALLALDTITCLVLIFTVRARWGNLAAILSSSFYAIHLPIIYYTAKISQVTSMLPLVVLWLSLFPRWEAHYESLRLAAITGAISGLMILNKTVYLPVPLLCAGLLLVSTYLKNGKTPHFRPAVLYGCVVFAVVMPWTFRNYIASQGKVIPVQSMFWELFVQDVLYSDLEAESGRHRPEGETLRYFIAREAQILVSHGVAPDYPGNIRRPQWEMDRENAFKSACIQWIREDPVRILKIKIANTWNFWIRAENFTKTRILLVMQVFYLGAAFGGLLLLVRFGGIEKIKYGLVLTAVLWGEHLLVFSWGRFSLDLVPVLAILFGSGVNAWVSNRKQVRSNVRLS